MVRGVGWWAGAVPVVMMVSAKLARAMRRKRTWRISDVLVSLFILAVAIATFMGFVQLEQANFHLLNVFWPPEFWLHTQRELMYAYVWFACTAATGIALQAKNMFPYINCRCSGGQKRPTK